MCKGDKEDPFIDQLKALANTVSMAIIGVLARHKPEPVPVRIIETELGVTESVASKHIRALRRCRLVRQATERRNGGYLADSAELCALLSPQSYTRIMQGFGQRQNDDTPGLS